MFNRKSSTPKTMGEAIKQGNRLVFTCDACKTTTYERPESLHCLLNVEIEFVERMS